MKNINVLVFPCGTEIGLELWRALKDIRFIKLYGASSAMDHGRYVFERYIGGVPFVSSPDFPEYMDNLCRDNGIDFIFPAHDDVQLALMRIQDRLSAKVVAPPLETVEICRHKAMTYEKLDGAFFMPKVYPDAKSVEKYPIVIKPSAGQGSFGVAVINSAEELEKELTERSSEQVIVEYLSGEEYTVDCFTDRHGSLRYCAFRTRQRIRNGISVCSRVMPPDEKVREIAEYINKAMSFRGVWFFQLKKNDEGEYRLLETATRVAGTMCVERISGVNLALLSIFDMLGYDVDITPQLESVEVERALVNRYELFIDYDEVYCDFDDTVTTHDKVNTQTIMFLYQCVNKNIPVYLLTRHDGDLDEALRRHRISRELFDGVIHIPVKGKKSEHITPSKKAIYIDDSFAEREDISKAFGIKTFGVDAIEGLIDWRG